MEITLTKDNFEAEVLKSEIPVLVDFWATWCGPCRMVAPELEKLDELMEGKIKIGKVNVDEQEKLAIIYRVEVIPTMILFENGKVVKKETGYATAEELKNKFF